MTVPRCNARTRSGGKCRQVAGWGTPNGPTGGQPGHGRCRLHGGMTPSGRRAAERLAAEEAVEVYGLPRTVAPEVALREELNRCNGHVAWLAALIAAFESRDELKQFAMGESGLWEKPSVWVQLYADERRHLVAIATAAIKCGLHEREVKLAEAQGQLVARVIAAVLAEVGIVPTDEVRRVIRRHIGLVTADDASMN